MAGTSFMMTLITFAIIVGINSKTFPYKGYEVTRETSVKDGVKNFTQALNKTVGNITTIDRTVELTNNKTNAKISTDHSITTKNNSVVTFDRTFEKFDDDGHLKSHDHFFNTSNGDTVIMGNNVTFVIKQTSHRWLRKDYLEVLEQPGHKPTLDKTVEICLAGAELRLLNISRCRLDNTQSTPIVFCNTTIIGKEGGKTISYLIARTRSDGSQYLDYSFTRINKENSIIFFGQAEANMSTDNSVLTIDSTDTFTNPLDNSKNVSHVIIINNKNGERNVERTIEHFAGNNTLLYLEFYKATVKDGIISIINGTDDKTVRDYINETMYNSQDNLKYTFGKSTFEKERLISDYKNLLNKTNNF